MRQIIILLVRRNPWRIAIYILFEESDFNPNHINNIFLRFHHFLSSHHFQSWWPSLSPFSPAAVMIQCAYDKIKCDMTTTFSSEITLPYGKSPIFVISNWYDCELSRPASAFLLPHIHIFILEQIEMCFS